MGGVIKLTGFGEERPPARPVKLGDVLRWHDGLGPRLKVAGFTRNGTVLAERDTDKVVFELWLPDSRIFHEDGAPISLERPEVPMYFGDLTSVSGSAVINRAGDLSGATAPRVHPPPDADRSALAELRDQLVPLRDENTRLKVENSDLRRENDRLRRAVKR